MILFMRMFDLVQAQCKCTSSIPQVLNNEKSITKKEFKSLTSNKIDEDKYQKYKKLAKQQSDYQKY